MCDCQVVGYAKQDYATEDQDTIVHGLRGSRRCWWPETEKYNDDHKCTGYNVNGYS